MGRYVLRRLLLILPTLIGIMVINFIVVQFAPGGPVEQMSGDFFRRAARAWCGFWLYRQFRSGS
jgi:ABC-type microcin C transport system permease subunit YejB